MRTTDSWKLTDANVIEKVLMYLFSYSFIVVIRYTEKVCNNKKEKEKKGNSRKI